ncbi:TonB-dependent receptor [Sphingobium sp. HWE2-09]|uniref:TonB-dependent receptor n=1 Tax=Sphingobium sp. HWE2-09 TaxID=3108390 RepID=UPI00403EAFB4
MRGVTFDPDQGTAPAVQVYYNEIPTDAQTAYTALYDIAQIEVLRGPQGLLRGLSAPAGSITIGTRRPNFDKIEGFMQGTGTDRAGYNVQGGVSLPFSDTLAIRVAGLVDGNRVNQVKDVNLGRRSRSTTESGRVTLGWRPSDAFTAYLTYQYLTADNTQFQQVVGSGNTPILGSAVRSGPALSASDYGAVAEAPFRSQNNTHIVNLAMDYDLGGSTLSFVGAHQFSKLSIDRDLDPANSVPGYVANSRVVTPYKVNTAELRWQTNNDKGLGGGIGAFYTKQTGTTVVDQRADSFIAPISPDGLVPLAPGFFVPNKLPIGVNVTVPTDTQTWSFAANLRYKTGPLTIEGGVRYSILKSIQTTQQTLFLGSHPLLGIPPGVTVVSGPTEIIPTNLQKNTNKPITGGLTVNYALSDMLNAYFAYGHSFRAGSTGVALPAGISDDLIRTRGEKTDSFEVGLKGSVLDRKVNYTLAAFYQKFDGYLSRFTSIYYEVPTAQPPSGFFDFNYNGDAKVKGIEASIDTRFVQNWDMNVSAAYTRARFSDALVPCNDFDGSGVPNQNGAPTVTGTGNVSYCRTSGRMAEVPDFSLTANSELRFSAGDYTPFVRALFTYRPGFTSERVNYDYQARSLLNMFVGLRGPESKWEITAFARNLLNQKRITNISLGNSQTPTQSGISYDSGYRLANVMNPREFGATLNFKW